MGLDMYLYSKFYVKNWDHVPKSRQYKITIKRGGKVTNIPLEKITFVECQEIYWRKANAIHKWFVDHVQDGKDDCGDYRVDILQLKELMNTVRKVINSTTLVKGKVNNGYEIKKGEDGKLEPVPVVQVGKILKDSSVAKKQLPVVGGFFFGGTEYDQWYWEDLMHTKRELERIIDTYDKEGLLEIPDFYYHSSW